MSLQPLPETLEESTARVRRIVNELKLVHLGTTLSSRGTEIAVTTKPTDAQVRGMKRLLELGSTRSVTVTAAETAETGHYFLCLFGQQ